MLLSQSSAGKIFTFTNQPTNLHASGSNNKLPITPPPDEYQLKERPSSNLKIVMGAGNPGAQSTMMNQYKYPQGNSNVTKRQNLVTGPSPMKLKILP